VVEPVYRLREKDGCHLPVLHSSVPSRAAGPQEFHRPAPGSGGGLDKLRYQGGVRGVVQQGQQPAGGFFPGNGVALERGPVQGDDGYSGFLRLRGVFGQDCGVKGLIGEIGRRSPCLAGDETQSQAKIAKEKKRPGVNFFAVS
jgi:hypothetical protein